MDPNIAVTTATAPTSAIVAGPEVSTSNALAPITGRELELLSQGAASPAAAKEALMLRDALTSVQQTDAQAEAAKAYADMKVNPQVLISFGSPATEEVDSVGKQLLEQVGGERIAEIHKLLKDLNDGMRDLQRGFDVKNSPEAREKFEEWNSGVRRWLRMGKNYLEMMVEEFKKYDTQLDGIAGELADQQEKMRRNLGFYDQLYKANQAAIDKLVYTIAVMEYIAEMAATEANSIVVADDQPDSQRKLEEKNRLTDLANNLQVKAGDFKGIYMIAVATAPQVRMNSNQILGVSAKLDTVRVQTIGAMRRLLAQWIMLIQTQGATALAQYVAKTNEQWTQQYLQNAPELVRAIAEGVQTPTLSVDTIAMMAKSIEDSATAVVTAMQKGYEDRLAVDEAIRVALPQINAAGAKVSDETIKMVLGSVIKAAENQRAQLSA